FHHIYFIFFFNILVHTMIYTLSLHDALPIFLELALYESDNCRTWDRLSWDNFCEQRLYPVFENCYSMKTFWPLELALYESDNCRDRKSTRLNSSHLGISYAVFCLKKKKK